MNFNELYNLKLHEYKQTKYKENIRKLLVLLLFSEEKEYENDEDLIEFYHKNKKIIDEKIDKVIKDFHVTKNEIIKEIKQITELRSYEEQKILIFLDSIRLVHISLLDKTKTKEELYSIFFNTNELYQVYNIEQKSIANNIEVSSLNSLITRVLKNNAEFYKNICKQLSEQERNFILSCLENKKCENCSNLKCMVEYKKRRGLDQYGHPMGSNCRCWYNEELIGRSKVLKTTNINNLKN